METAYQREPRWQRIVWPHSYDPATGLTSVRWFWHPIHVKAAINRARWWRWARQQRSHAPLDRVLDLLAGALGFVTGLVLVGAFWWWVH